MSGVILSSTASRKHRYIDEFKEQLSKLSNAGIGVILVKSREPYRAQEVLQEWSLENEIPFRVWTILTGWQYFEQPGASVVNKHTATIEAVDVTKPSKVDKMASPDKALTKIHDSPDEFPNDGCYVVMHMQFAFDNPAVQQFIKAHVQDAMETAKRVIFIVPEICEIPPSIENDIYLLEFRTPSHLELRAIWDSALERYLESSKNCLSHFKEKDIEIIIQNSVGMSFHEFDTALALSFVEHKERMQPTHENPVTPQELIDDIIKTKVETIKKTEILELMPQADMKDIGGLSLVKEWLEMRTKAFGMEARKYGVDQPKGMMVVGPPGTGKSLLAKATSAVFGIPCIKLDIGKVFGSLVGQSEERIRRALRMVESMSPCVLLLDEVDKGLSGMSGSGDSGTSARVFASLLTWLQERNINESPVFIIMTANNVEGMPPELMRRGRLDEIFAVNFPNPDERKQILKIHCERRGHKLTDEDYNRIASDDNTKDFVGAELEAIVKDAITVSFYKGLKRLTADELLIQAKTIVPLSKAFADKVNRMNDWAKNNAKPASDLYTGEAIDNDTSGHKLQPIKRRLVKPLKTGPREVKN